jgi:DNA-binding response OmpR family regulator
MHVLVVEDEPRMLELLRQGLEDRDCTVVTANDGFAGLEMATHYPFDAILLDIGLPLRDGFEVVRSLRLRNRNTPILMLTARDAEDDIIRGLELGADDYLTKPFSFLELMARLQSIVRPLRVGPTLRFEAGDLVVDLARRNATRATRPINLSRSEFSLLATLIQNPGQCVPRRKLMEGVWGTGADVAQGALDVLVNALRAKIDSPFHRKIIRTVRGAGYLLAAEFNASPTSHPDTAR